MKKWFSAIGILCMIAVGVTADGVQASGSNTFSMTATGTTPWIQCADSSTAYVVFTSGTGTVVPQGQIPSGAAVTIGSVNGGSITTAGTYSGSMTGYGTQMRVSVTVSSGPVVGAYYCSTQLARVAGAPVIPVGPPSGGDDSTAIQAAENLCNTNGGGVVSFQAGTYHASNITYYSNCISSGAGIGATTVLLVASSNNPVFASYNFASLTGTNSASGVSNAGFANLTIDGNKANESGGAACVQWYGWNPVFSHVQIQSCYGDGLYTEYASTAVPAIGGTAGAMYDIRSTTNGGNGITFKGPHDGVWDNVITSENAGVGLKVTGHGNGMVLSNFHSWGSQQTYALYIDAGNTGLICSNCQVEGASTAQLYIDGQTNSYRGKIYSSPTSAPDIVIGNAAGNGASQNIIAATVNTLAGQTAPVISIGKDNGLNQYQINTVCASPAPAAVSGTGQTTDSYVWTNLGCTGPKLQFDTTGTVSFGTISAHFGSNAAINSNGSSANTGSLDVNNNAGATNNTQGVRIFDGGTTNAVQIKPNNGNGIVTITFPSAAPSGACVPGSIATRVDSSAGLNTEMYVCRNVAGTGTWEALLGG